MFNIILKSKQHRQLAAAS